MKAQLDQEVVTARGRVNMDVVAEDTDTVPSSTFYCECKHWRTSVPKTVVHAFRTVETDGGANLGMIISSAGVQSGAYEAAEYSNVRLLKWEEFQALFAPRWFEHYMLPELMREVDPLIEYTEPINSRITRKAAVLSERETERFERLREKYQDVAFFALAWTIRGRTSLPDMPLEPVLSGRPGAKVPEQVLAASALRELLESLRAIYIEAIAEFDEVFGGRA